MASKIKDLIKRLEKEDPGRRVEFVVVGEDGALVCMDIEDANAADLSRVLGLFSGNN